MKFLVLGAAAGGGLPQWNCGCQNCCDARRGALATATQSSLAVSCDGQTWAVLNASPDLRVQLQACPQMHPRSLRDTPVSSVVLTNADIDHIAGLLSLREQTEFSVFATREILGLLDQNAVFDVLSRQKVTRHGVEMNVDFQLLEGLKARFFAVPGKVPLFMEGETVQTDLLGEQTVGLRLSDGQKLAYYIPGCATVTAPLLAQIEDADLLFFDGTLWRDDEMQTSGTGEKTGARMGHISISGAEGSLEKLRALTAQKVYIHINNTNPIWQRTGSERQFVEQNGWAVAADGMEIDL